MKEENKFETLANALNKVDDALAPTLADLVHLTDALDHPKIEWGAYGVTKTPQEYKEAIKQQIERAHNALNALWDELERI